MALRWAAPLFLILFYNVALGEPEEPVNFFFDEDDELFNTKPSLNQKVEAMMSQSGMLSVYRQVEAMMTQNAMLIVAAVVLATLIFYRGHQDFMEQKFSEKGWYYNSAHVTCAQSRAYEPERAPEVPSPLVPSPSRQQMQASPVVQTQTPHSQRGRRASTPEPNWQSEGQPLQPNADSVRRMSRHSDGQPSPSTQNMQASPIAQSQTPHSQHQRRASTPQPHGHSEGQPSQPLADSARRTSRHSEEQPSQTLADSSRRLSRTRRGVPQPDGVPASS